MRYMVHIRDVRIARIYREKERERERQKERQRERD
jgi:hypothetical protein